MIAEKILIKMDEVIESVTTFLSLYRKRNVVTLFNFDQDHEISKIKMAVSLTGDLTLKSENWLS